MSPCYTSHISSALVCSDSAMLWWMRRNDGSDGYVKFHSCAFRRCFFECAFLVSFPLPLSCTASYLATMSPLRLELHLRIKSWQTDFSGGNYWRHLKTILPFGDMGTSSSYCSQRRYGSVKVKHLGATCLGRGRPQSLELCSRWVHHHVFGRFKMF